LCHQVQTAEEKHVLQVLGCGIGKWGKMNDGWRNEHQQAAGHNADGNGEMA
jgi:hypothetical protein